MDQIVHLAVPDEQGVINSGGMLTESGGLIGGKGRWMLACSRELRPSGERGAHRFSGEPMAVTCPECKRTEAFRKRVAEIPSQEHVRLSE